MRSSSSFSWISERRSSEILASCVACTKEMNCESGALKGIFVVVAEGSVRFLVVMPLHAAPLVLRQLLRTGLRSENRLAQLSDRRALEAELRRFRPKNQPGYTPEQPQIGAQRQVGREPDAPLASADDRGGLHADIAQNLRRLFRDVPSRRVGRFVVADQQVGKGIAMLRRKPMFRKIFIDGPDSRGKGLSTAR